MERLAPPRKDSSVIIEIPHLATAQDIAAAIAKLTAAVSHGELTPSEGIATANLIEVQRRVLETVDFAARIKALEAKPI